MGLTKIEWCDETANPIVGCSKCSPGCDNCYAEKFAARLAKNPNPKIAAKYAGVVDERGRWTGRINCDWSGRRYGPMQGLRISVPGRMVFLGSMCDLFHENVPEDKHREIFMGLGCMSHHRFRLLTKRPHMARARLGDLLADPYYSHVGLGVTVCNKAELGKLDILRSIPAALRFISFEPLLEGLGEINLDGIGWVIAGGETGAKARPMHPDWVRSIRNQCAAAGIPFFFKGWGKWGYQCQVTCNPDELVDARRELIVKPDGSVTSGLLDYGHRAVIMRKAAFHKAGRLLDGREHNERVW